MKSVVVALLLSCCLLPQHIMAQSRWIEQWITVGEAQPVLLEVSREDALKNQVERRIYQPNVSDKEDWGTLFKMEYDSTRLKRTSVYSKQVENGTVPSMVIVESYDSRAKRIKTTAFNGVDTLNPKLSIIYKYDPDFNLIQETTTGLTDGVQKRYYKYEGKLVSDDWMATEDSSISEHYTYKYNEAGKVIEKKLQIEPDILAKQLYTWKYNDAGKMIEENIYLSDGSLYRKHTFFYDKNGDLSEVVEYGEPNDALISKINYQYLPAN